MTVDTRAMRPKAAVVATDQDAASAAIARVFERLETALAAKDAVAFDSVFTDDVVFINPAGSVFSNWDELHAYHLTAMRDSPDAEAHYTILAVRLLAGGHAIVNVEQTLRTPDFSVTNRGTWVFTERDDNWWVCSVHNTNVAGTAERHTAEAASD
ncbi:nuclear transport factor 2 family protein [Nocardia sp. NBC_01503]|uniref:YybH family protein n=1 Tax=Nocardia sp. NBC_01503 TaxID=2975997 RepID=UPI002E7BC81F|nr:nuclear transport factor 2 family protein [Nocardia sp. NBC_01503]WTL33369.1 nuclear transport factor 2 family protein [Nocardia sp. NBC_01503]